MKCPVDGETLVIAERSGVEIDYCPKCRGVWLDRGELDKIIDRADSALDRKPETHRSEKHERSDVTYDYRDAKHGKRRKDSILGELFDFF